MFRRILLALVSGLMAMGTMGQQLFVNGKSGDDAALGTKAQPLKTIREAARRLNTDTTKGAATIVVSEGIYLLTETVLFHNDKCSRENRLVLRAEVLPDDPGWMPRRMPLIVTAAPMAKSVGGEEAKGLQFECSHVTVEGFRFSGSPDYSYIDSQNLSRSYPIWRDGKDLDDLLVTQCLFAGDPDVLPLHLGVIANGQGLVVDHCVFFRCRNSVVFWRANGTSHHNAMQYCLVYGGYFSGVWTTQSTGGDDFEFHHNVIAQCRTAWIRENGSMDQSRKNYLQLAEGSDGAELKAGLFKVFPKKM